MTLLDSWIGTKNGGEKARLDPKTAWLVQGPVAEAARSVALNSLSGASWTALRTLFRWRFLGYGSRTHGGLLEEVSEPEDEETRRPKGR
jgi:hypothetical protein